MIGRLTLSDFRNHADALIMPDHSFIVLTGDKGAGKTNILEAVSMLAPGRGLRGAALRDMVRQFSLPIEIIPAETVRDEDGLALSSRNQYLSPEQRSEAPRLYRALCRIRDELVGGSREGQRLELDGMAVLARNGWRPDYIAVRRQADLQPPGPGDVALVAVAAARLGNTRLIDNVEISLAP